MDVSPSTLLDDTPPWVGWVRHFIGTGDERFLTYATERCGDTATREFLLLIAQCQEEEGHMPLPADFQRLSNQVLEKLVAESRLNEAALVELLVRRSSVRLATLNIHAKGVAIQDNKHLVDFAFDRGIDLARSLRYFECEAYFAGALGDYERSLGNWQAACEAHNHAFVLYGDEVQARSRENPASRELLAAYSLASLDVAIKAAVSNGGAGHEKNSIELMDHVADVARMLRAVANIGRSVALRAHAAFSELARTRQLRLAKSLGELAVDLYRDVDIVEKGAQQRYDLALCLSEFGQFLSRIGEASRGAALCVEGVQLLEGLLEEHTWFFQAPLGIAYGTLANAYRLNSQPVLALSSFARSAHWLRLAASEGEDNNRIRLVPHLVTALQNYGNALRSAGDREHAVESFEEALTLTSELRDSGYSVAVREWVSYGGLFLLATDEDRLTDACVLGERAMELLESTQFSEHEIWTEKGLARDLYVSMFEQYARSGDYAHAFRCLVALRTEGRVLNTEPTKALSDSLRQLASLSREHGRPIALLCPQTLLGPGFMIALLRNAADSVDYSDCGAFIEYFDCGVFLEPALHLWELVAVPDPRDGDKSGLSLAREAAAERAWAVLPAAIKEVLARRDGGQTLICGDDSWSSFPWEAIKFGPAADDMLGLHYLLPRWPSPDASSLLSIAAGTVDGTSSNSAVICPWNATEARLEGARREGIVVAEILASYSETRMIEMRLLGAGANREAVAEVLARTPDIIHYAGHGAILDGEEVLVLYGSDEAAPFGSRELRLAYADYGPSEAKRKGRLVVLNCCYCGRVRSFGGKHEDLASTFLSTGVSGVVASATPVVDECAGMLGVLLHQCFVRGEEPVSTFVVRARRLVARCMQALGRHSWAGWSTTVYYGSPFVSYRHSLGVSESERRGLAPTVAASLARIVTKDPGQEVSTTQLLEAVLENELVTINCRLVTEEKQGNS